jgi:arabinogalactan oligomer/maltooligosaccharide transport system permease protein
MKKEKTVRGLNIKYLNGAILASVIGMIGLLLPYVSAEGEKISYLTASGWSWLTALAAAAVLVMGVLAIINFFRTTVWGMRIAVIVGSVGTAALSVLLFASKSIVDKADVLGTGFLVKNFGVGYWLCLVASYAALALTMKTLKINTGYIVLVILSVIWLFPISWILLTSFRAESGYYVGYYLPKGFTLDNYIQLFKNPSVLPFGRWWCNTLIVAACNCVINTLIVLATSYVLSRTRFAGRIAFMKILMIIGMFPGFMSMIAVYNILKGVGLNQSLVALVVVSAAGAAMGYHICKGFFDTIPKALDEAAIIDGATRWQIFTRITIPLSKPIIIYTVLCNFLGAWSDYIFPSMLMGDKQASYTVAVGLKWMTDYRRIDTYYTQFAAGAVLVAVPIVILFIWLQKYYVEGLSGAVKG